MAYTESQVFLAEIIGTFLLVIFGNGGTCNALLPGTKGHGIGFLGIAFCFGWGVYVALQSVGHISGFFNPAVAFAGAVVGHVSWKRMLLCWAAEFVGAGLAAVVLYLTYLPHFQPLELLCEEHDIEHDSCNVEDCKVAVVRQEMEHSAKRYASVRNRHPGKGIQVEPEQSAHGLLDRVFPRTRIPTDDHHRRNGVTKKVVSSADLKGMQVRHVAFGGAPSLEQRIEEDQEVKLVVFCTRPSTQHLYWIFALWAEFLGTALLTYMAFTFGDRGSLQLPDVPVHSLFKTGLEPLLVGLMMFGVILALGGVTGPALNPARDLAPRLVHWVAPIPGKGSSEWWYAWVPVLGPLGGAVVGALFARELKDVTRAGLQ